MRGVWSLDFWGFGFVFFGHRIWGLGFYSYLIVTGVWMSGCRDRWTGQAWMEASRGGRRSWGMEAGRVSSRESEAMRRGGVVVIDLWMVHLAAPRSRPCFFREMAMVVRMQVANAVARRSVGEKDSPRPWLSLGASVARVAAEGA